MSLTTHLLARSLARQLEMLELEAAMQMLDKNGDDQISFDEFIDWWRTGGSQD